MSYLMKRIIVRKKLANNLWASASDGIVISEAYDYKVVQSLGGTGQGSKRKDTFDFSVSNADNNLFVQTFSGDGSTKDFDLKYYPVPSSFEGTTKALVYIDGVEALWATDYTFTNSYSRISFTNAPANGYRNVELRFSVIETDDLVRIYRWKDTESYGDDDLLQEGPIVNPKGTLSPDSRKMVILGESLITVLFNGLANTAQIVGTRDLAHEYIWDILVQINEFNQDRIIYGRDSTEWTALGNASATKTIQFSTGYRPAIELIEELSSNEQTDIGNCIYYVKYNASVSNYEFIWKAKSNKIVHTFTEGTDPFVRVRAAKDIRESYSSAIYHCGSDCEDAGIEFPYFNHIASSGGSGRWKYITKTQHLAEEIRKKEFENTPAKWDTQSIQGVDHRVGKYPNDYSSYTSFYHDRDDAGVLKSSYYEPSTDATFNAMVWAECKWLGEAIVKGVMNLIDKPRYSIVLEVPYGSDSRSYTLGDMYAINLKSYGVFGKKLRLTDITYTPSTTDLTLVEDELSV